MMDQLQKRSSAARSEMSNERKFPSGKFKERPALRQLLGIGLLVLGIVLIIFGMDAADSVDSDFSRLFAGSPIAKALWLLAGGIVSVIVGGMICLRPEGH